jgi:guanylate kinase
MLIVISAPSGAGKTTIVKEVIRRNPDYIFSVSATTRKKRENEIDGKDYFFLTKEDFINKINEDELVEYETVFNGEYYGTLKSFIDANLVNKKTVLFDVDVNGALSIKNIYKEDAILIFIMPPNLEVLKERLMKRASENSQEIQERMRRVDLEIQKGNKFDYIVVNDHLENAVDQVQQIIQNHKKKLKQKE